MNYLPIADRELRVAVRKRSTFWLRVAAALTGLVIGGGCLLLNEVFGANSVRMGGIWKATLALVNALFVSLAAGLAVSVVSRDSQKALTATVFVLLMLALAGPLADGSIAGAKHRTFQPQCSLSSPAYVLTAASALSRSAYWSALALTQWRYSTGGVVRLVATVECSADRRLGRGQGHRFYRLVMQQTTFLPPCTSSAQPWTTSVCDVTADGPTKTTPAHHRECAVSGIEGDSVSNPHDRHCGQR